MNENIAKLRKLADGALLTIDRLTPAERAEREKRGVFKRDWWDGYRHALEDIEALESRDK